MLFIANFIWIYKSENGLILFINGGLLGAGGALMSVLQRFKQITVEKYSSLFIYLFVV